MQKISPLDVFVAIPDFTFPLALIICNKQRHVLYSISRRRPGGWGNAFAKAPQAAKPNIQIERLNVAGAKVFNQGASFLPLLILSVRGNIVTLTYAQFKKSSGKVRIEGCVMKVANMSGNVYPTHTRTHSRMDTLTFTANRAYIIHIRVHRLHAINYSSHFNPKRTGARSRV